MQNIFVSNIISMAIKGRNNAKKIVSNQCVKREFSWRANDNQRSAQCNNILFQTPMQFDTR